MPHLRLKLWKLKMKLPSNMMDDGAKSTSLAYFELFRNLYYDGTCDIRSFLAKFDARMEVLLSVNLVFPDQLLCLLLWCALQDPQMSPAAGIGGEWFIDPVIYTVLLPPHLRETERNAVEEVHQESKKEDIFRHQPASPSGAQGAYCPRAIFGAEPGAGNARPAVLRVREHKRAGLAEFCASRPFNHSGQGS